MKIAPLLLIPVSSLETASTTAALLSAVGHRNVTHMENLIQGLAGESIQNPSWKLDTDIKSALDKIRDVFVSSIQASIRDAHRVEQNAHNCGTKTCFGACNHEYTNSIGVSCGKMEGEITDWQEKHEQCRELVYKSYKTMAIACAKLDCWCLPPLKCPYEDCLCQDVDNCHHDYETDKHGKAIEGAYESAVDHEYVAKKRHECVPHTKSSGDCAGHFGKWLSSTAQRYREAFKEWSGLHKACSTSYSEFLSVDLECDKTQRHFEASKCGQLRCQETTCNVEFSQCIESCWDQYNSAVKDLQCTEKDRKIDWSATKKIECYLNVLLYDFEAQLDLLKNCGTDKESCISERRTKMYGECQEICLEVDHDAKEGWPAVTTEYNKDGIFDGHCKVKGPENRTHDDEYHLGDSAYECDRNGDIVFTDHRAHASTIKEARAIESRCTEHLDIDFQIPSVRPCAPAPDPICDCVFHKLYYEKFDGHKQVSCITPHLCPAKMNGYGGGDDTCSCSHHTEGCHQAIEIKIAPPGPMDVCWPNGKDVEPQAELIWTEVYEHSEAWAYNRCPCQDCIGGYPEYNPPHQPECSGVHTPHIRDVSHGAYGAPMKPVHPPVDAYDA
jgi:hypothetical protein